jgi:hypothetical protein
MQCIDLIWVQETGPALIGVQHKFKHETVGKMCKKIVHRQRLWLPGSVHEVKVLYWLEGPVCGQIDWQQLTEIYLSDEWFRTF